jgi:hypothetical protein
MGLVPRLGSLKLTDVLQLLNKVVTQIQCVQHMQVFQVFNLPYHVELQIQVTKFRLVSQVFNALNAVILKPQTFQSCVFLQVLYLPVTCKAIFIKIYMYFVVDFESKFKVPIVLFMLIG